MSRSRYKTPFVSPSFWLWFIHHFNESKKKKKQKVSAVKHKFPRVLGRVLSNRHSLVHSPRFYTTVRIHSPGKAMRTHLSRSALTYKHSTATNISYESYHTCKPRRRSIPTARLKYRKSGKNIVGIPSATKALASLRSTRITAAMLGGTFSVHDGRVYRSLLVTREMIGTTFGDYTPTKQICVYRRSKNKRKNKNKRNVKKVAKAKAASKRK